MATIGGKRLNAHAAARENGETIVANRWFLKPEGACGSC
jgi:hypothetical protein